MQWMHQCVRVARGRTSDARPHPAIFGCQAVEQPRLVHRSRRQLLWGRQPAAGGQPLCCAVQGAPVGHCLPHRTQRIALACKSSKAVGQLD